VPFALREVLVQSGVRGTVLALLLHPAYAAAVAWLRARLGPHWASDRALYNLFLNGSHAANYIFWSFFFGCLDYFQLLQRYKLPRHPSSVASRSTRWRAIKDHSLTLLVVNPVAFHFCYVMFEWFGVGRADDPLPPVHVIFATMCVAQLCASAGLYYVHRELHRSKILYNLHKLHHTFVASEALVAEYAHAVEGVLSNMIPNMISVLLMGSHPFVASVWLVSE
jgi:sterol desaturase/sphingolipid hydroxylase (fatty acid hydroxylase superfamily)